MPDRKYGNVGERDKLEILLADTIQATLARLYPELADSPEFRRYATDERIRNMNLPKMYHNSPSGKEIELPKCEQRRIRIIRDCVDAIEIELKRIYDREIRLLEPNEHEIDLTPKINDFKELADYIEEEILEAVKREHLVAC
ncbi:hypothetical protein FJZ19_03195 [Candidatus Pacearchaeota archaeon]|nr:hypothetical protein [Candidatus Pacearchaeota archaeon]